MKNKLLIIATTAAISTSAFAASPNENVSKECNNTVANIANMIANGQKPTKQNIQELTKNCQTSTNDAPENVTPEQCIRHFDKAFELSQTMFNKIVEPDPDNPDKVKIKDDMASIYTINDANKLAYPSLALIWIQQYFNDLICSTPVAGYNTASTLNDMVVMAWAPYSKIEGFKSNEGNNSANTYLRLEKNK